VDGRCRSLTSSTVEDRLPARHRRYPRCYPVLSGHKNIN
jgi:hypothetical protein